MKVFLSWSGNLSKEVALVLRSWLPSVLQAVEPYVSSEDIRKGNRWSSEIASELESTTYGIIVLTPENIEAPWINFETGALAKTVDNSLVSPFLFGIKNSDVKGPLTQFQATLYDKDDLKKLLFSINEAMLSRPLNESRLEVVFEKWWPDLEEQLEKLITEIPSYLEKKQLPGENNSSNNNDILEELLELSRAQQRILTNPEEFLPRNYLNTILGDKSEPIHQEALRELLNSYNELFSIVNKMEEKKYDIEETNELKHALNQMGSTIHYFRRKIIRTPVVNLRK